jgi:hypothetical protein
MVDDAAFVSFAKGNELFVAGFFNDIESEIGRKFESVAKLVDDIEFIYSFDPSAAKEITYPVGPHNTKPTNKATTTAASSSSSSSAEVKFDEVPIDSLVVFKNFDEQRNIINLKV